MILTREPVAWMYIRPQFEMLCVKRSPDPVFPISDLREEFATEVRGRWSEEFPAFWGVLCPDCVLTKLYRMGGTTPSMESTALSSVVVKQGQRITPWV